MPLRFLVAVAVLVLGAATSLAPLTASGATSSSLVPLPLPGVRVNDLNYPAIACTGTTSCTAVGGATLSSQPHVAVDDLAGPSWGPAATIGYLRGTASSSNEPGLAGISCPSRGTCLAVGAMLTPVTYGHLRPMALEESNGRWGGLNAGLPRPRGLTDAQPTAVWCGSAGSCVVVGTAGNNPPALRWSTYVAAERDGRWSQAVTLASPSDDLMPGPINAYPTSVSCVDPANCVLVGYFLSGRLGAETGTLSYAETETAGRWSPPIVLTDRFSRSAFLTGVSCVTAVRCVAVGMASLPSSFTGTRPFSVTIEDGRWSGLRLLAMPPSSTELFGGSLSGVWCRRGVPACVAVGDVWTTPTGPSTPQKADGAVPAAFTWTGSAWHGVQLPDTLEGTPGGARLVAVSCAGGLGSCVATGLWTSADGTSTVPVSASV